MLDRESLTGDTLDALNRALDQSAAGDTEDLGDFTQYAKDARTERERLAVLIDAGAFSLDGWGNTLERESERMDRVGLALRRADAILAAGFRYTPPENYHSCNPFCEQH